ncbi:Vacuolar protein-sorting-associated protein 28 [Cymbomonas tetramitiformis]|uniref:Vacuolar protein-sorting-associated protein 28 n=1 Tax=Cymbomonas tetramitiformis TaxID=36881 RepID=A0AAE0G572_9CHLO|nr:Vacuolar protein-sorting-associated protein 28 [Cymbomonas tetramitiformis]
MHQYLGVRKRRDEVMDLVNKKDSTKCKTNTAKPNHRTIEDDSKPPLTDLFTAPAAAELSSWRFDIFLNVIMSGVTQELKLWSNKYEREAYDTQADLFALIKAVDRLEKAYVRDAISAKEYESNCFNLLAKFKTLQSTMRDTVPDVQQFMASYNMDCPAAVNRLLVSGMPATVEHGPTREGTNGTVVVAETVQHFITTMDSLNLKMVAMDQIYPLLNDLTQSLHKVSGCSSKSCLPLAVPLRSEQTL